MSPVISIMQPILRFLQLLCENHNRDLQVRRAGRVGGRPDAGPVPGPLSPARLLASGPRTVLGVGEGAVPSVLPAVPAGPGSCRRLLLTAWPLLRVCLVRARRLTCLCSAPRVPRWKVAGGWVTQQAFQVCCLGSLTSFWADG